MAQNSPNPVVTVGHVRFGNGLPLALIAGPCQMESRAHALEMASALREIAGRVGIGDVTGYSSASSLLSVVLCLACVRSSFFFGSGSAAVERTGPTRSRAMAFTAVTARKGLSFFFVLAIVSVRLC